MIESSPVSSPSSEPDEQLAAVVDEVSRKIQAGQLVDLEGYVRQHPDWAERLRRLFPAMQSLAELGLSLSSDSRNDVQLPLPSHPPTSVLGDYRILREIGRGGMGVVYEAEQLSLHRRVALKMLPLAGILDHRQLQRFKTEAQAAAMLHQDNIVPVFGVGCERGVHYYAMQFIEGQTLAQLIRDLRRQEGLDAPAAAAPGRADSMAATTSRRADSGDAEATASAAPQGAGGLSPERESSSEADPTTGYSPQPPSAAPSAETQPVAGAAIATQRSSDRAAYFRGVADLGAHVADALEHAHEEGVIHRDIKPSNLILDQRGKVWVTDFGLARIASDPGISMTGDIVGTLRYMSPEQALAKRVLVDHRTDVYSLCATLYELLTLEPVFRGHDRQEVIKRIAFDEPRGLCKLNKAIPAELETIVLKGLEKNPDRRYATAKEVAEDLRRFLENKPIRAKPPTLAQRAAKWSRRNKPLVASAAAILLLGVLALAVSNVLITRERDAAAAAAETAQRERDEAQTQRAKADQQRQVAEENFRRAREAVDTYLTKVSEEQLLNEPGMQKLRESLLRLALEYYQGFVKQRSDDPEVLAELAAAHGRVGVITSRIGTRKETRKAYEESLRLHKQLVGRHPDNPRYRNDLAGSYLDLGEIDQSTGQLEQAFASFQEAIKVRRKLVSDHPNSPEHENDLATAYVCLGDLQLREKRYKDALQSLEEAIAIGERLKRLPEKHPDSHKHLDTLAESYARKATVLFYIRDYSEALAAHENELRICERLVEEYPSSLEYQSGLATTHNNTANVWLRMGDVDRALALYKKSIEVEESLAAENPLVLRYQNELAVTTANMAFLQRNEDSGKAIAVFGIAIDKMRDLVKKDPSNVRYREHLAEWLCGRGSLQADKFRAYDEAIADQTESVKIRAQLVADHPSLPSAIEDLLGAYLQRSKYYKKVGKYDEAIADQTEWIKIRTQLVADQASLSSDKEDLARAHLERSRFRENVGESDDAIADGTAAIDTRVGAVEQESEPWLARKRLAFAHVARAGTYGLAGKHDESIRDYEEALRWLRQSVELASDRVDRLERMDTVNRYFAVCEAAGKHAEAKNVWKETREDVEVKVADEQLPTQNPADYVLRIEEPGEYQLYIRWGGEDGRGGCILAGLFNDQDQAVDWYLFQGGHPHTDAGDGDADFATHAWETFGGRRRFRVGSPDYRPETMVLEQPALFSVPRPGMYFLRLMNTYVPIAADAMVFQQSHLPAPENEGPPESPRDADGAFVASGGRVTVEAEHFSFAIASWVVVPNEKEPEARHKHFRGSGYLLTQEWGKDAKELDVARTQQAFEVKRRVLGETHPSTLLSMAELACRLIWNQKRYEEAEKLHQQLLERWKDMNAQDSALEDKLNMLSLNVYWRCDWRSAEVFGRQGVERARRFDPDGVELMFNAVPFLLLSGQKDEYRRICQELLEKHAQTESAATAAQVVRMCVLDPDFGESQRLVSLGQRAAKGDKDWNLYALGMAYCRVGDYDKALQWLQKAFDSQGRTPGGQAIVARQLAITYHRAGRTEEAKSWLDKMGKLIEPLGTVSIPARNETYVYGREAKSLIQAPAAKPSPADANR